MKLQFVLVIYYLTSVRKLLVNYQCMHRYICIQIYTLRTFQILKYFVALIFIRVHSPLFFCHFSTAIFHMRCPDPDHFVTSQLQPFHAECPGPGHSTRNLCEVWQPDAPTYYLLFRMYSGFGSTSCLLLLKLCRQVRIFIRQCF